MIPKLSVSLLDTDEGSLWSHRVVAFIRPSGPGPGLFPTAVCEENSSGLPLLPTTNVAIPLEVQVEGTHLQVQALPRTDWLRLRAALEPISNWLPPEMEVPRRFCRVEP